MFDLVPILNGRVTASVPAAVAQNESGDMNLASEEFSRTFMSTGPDATPGSPSAGETATGPVSYVITYTGAEAITLSPDDIMLNATGTATGTVSVSGEGLMERTITISDISGEGTLSITVVSGTAVDAAGDPSAGFGPTPAITVDPGAQVGLAAPTGVRATDGLSFLAVIVKWDAVTGAEMYEVYSADVEDFDQASLLGTTRFTHFADFSAPAPTGPDFGCIRRKEIQQFYWVVAVAPCGESDPSEPGVGSRGITGLIILEAALPLKHGGDGERIADTTSTLAVRRHADAAAAAQGLGLGVNAGHDLSLENLGRFLEIPDILEVSIGHALVVECLYEGLPTVIRR